MSASYERVVKGKLSFKGQTKSTNKRKRANEQTASSSSSNKADISAAATAKDDTVAAEGDTEVLVERQGTGRITSSGTTVHGHYSEFMTQLSAGDAIIITHPQTLQQETKVVRMVLSNVSIGISSSFSTDLISTTAFKFIKAPKDEGLEREQQQQAIRKKHKSEEDAFGTYASQGGEQIVYREKKSGSGGGGSFGGYKIVTKTLSGPGAMTREQLLQLRSKKKSDRHCY